LHAFWVGNLRLVLDVQVSSGRQRTSAHGKTALGRLLDELGDGPEGRRPVLVGGDSGCGNEGILLELEGRGQPYLLRLHQTANVQRLVAQQFARQDWSRADSHGCQMVEDHLQLLGWSKQRWVVVVRQRIEGSIARERRVDGKQLKLDLADPGVHEGERLWECAVMVTDARVPIEAIGQLYRDRAACENGFGELKNQWGLIGFTTQDINRCQTTARSRAPVCNWWSWYCRAANPSARMEAITSRPLLLAAVERATHSGGHTTLGIAIDTLCMPTNPKTEDGHHIHHANDHLKRRTTNRTHDDVVRNQEAYSAKHEQSHGNSIEQEQGNGANARCEQR
jgi:Transposase DDE domain